MGKAVEHSYYLPALQVVKGYQEQQHTIKHMVDACWKAAYVILWNGGFFSTNEENEAKARIKCILINAPDLENGYRAFVERILLSRRYLRTDIESLRQSPAEWFFTTNKRGFCRSSQWYEAVVQKRTAKPLYALGLKAFADAVLEMQEDPSSTTFHYWRGYFLERNSQGLLNLILAYAACLKQ